MEKPNRVVLMRVSSDAECRIVDDPSLIAEQLHPESDTFCLLPSRMRCLCLLLTLLLIISLAAAIGNSIQSSGFKSVSFCKTDEQEFGPDVLCPKESMFFYYECCTQYNSTLTHEPLFCCSRSKFWLIIAMISVVLSFVVGINYTILRYVCRWS